MTHCKSFLITLFSVGLLLSGCVKNPVTGKREFHMISQKAELRLGQETKMAIIREYGLFHNPEVQAYINEVGQKIVEVCDRKDVQYEFIILDTPLVNAFAVPGVVFLTTGILELMDDEAELATVIGHEVGHITGFHAVKLIQKSYGYGFLATFAAVAGTIYTPDLNNSNEYAAYYDTLYRGIGLISAGFLSGYGRQFELEADRSGLRYAILAGYDPDAMISFFKRMKSLGEDNTTGISLFLRTHPPTNQRIGQVKSELSLAERIGASRKKKIKGPESREQMVRILRSTDTRFEDHFERYHKIVRSFTRRDQDQAGTIKDNEYTNPGLGVRLKVPRRWKLEHSHGGALVSFFSPDGKAQGELQAKRLPMDPAVILDETAPIAGISRSTRLLTGPEWAESVEESMRLEKRTGREVTYPVGPSYVGTYRGRDRVGRPALFKILFLVKGETREDQMGYMLSCAAPEGSYLDYLLDFEMIMRGLGWLDESATSESRGKPETHD